MRNKLLAFASGLVLLGLLGNYQIAFAHEGVTAGDYELEVGWLNEPPVVGQQNAIVVNVAQTGGEPVEDISSLEVIVAYGGQSKSLTLQPLSEDAPGHYIAPILPMVPGQYTLTLSGKLGDTAVSAEVNPEEVQTSDTLQFPLLDAPKPAGESGWFAWVGDLLGLIGTGLGVIALRKVSALAAERAKKP